MENPYASSDPQTSSSAKGGGASPSLSQRPAGLVRHVRIVAILMIVQAFLELLMGMLALAYAIGFPMFMQMAPDAFGAPDASDVQAMSWMMAVMFGGASLLAFTAGATRLWAGIENVRFRGRTMGLVGSTVGLLSALTCYCAPTSIGVSVYSMIVMLDPAVEEAFDLRVPTSGSPGVEINEIYKRFNA